MKDGKQGLSFDRWLMRIKDIMQIILTIGGLFWAAAKWMNNVEQQNARMIRLERKNAILMEKLKSTSPHQRIQGFDLE